MLFFFRSDCWIQQLLVIILCRLIISLTFLFIFWFWLLWWLSWGVLSDCSVWNLFRSSRPIILYFGLFEKSCRLILSLTSVVLLLIIWRGADSNLYLVSRFRLCLFWLFKVVKRWRLGLILLFSNCSWLFDGVNLTFWSTEIFQY